MEDIQDLHTFTIEIKVGEAIKKRKLTQKSVAERSGIREAAISSLSRGYVDRISLDHLTKLANALQIEDINELITIKKAPRD